MKLVADLTATTAPFRPRHPIAPPSLVLDFAAGFYGAASFAELVTFSRGSTATYFDAAGTLRAAAVDMPRFDHDPITGAALGLVIEESRTNLELHSEQLDNAAWIKSNVAVTANAVVAPDGAASADLVASTAGTTGQHIRQTTAISAGTDYTMSLFFFAGSSNAVWLRILNGAGTRTLGAVLFDPIAATVTSSTNLLSPPTIAAIGGGWFRLSAAFNSTTETSLVTYLYPSNAVDNSGSVHLWGVQLEAGGFASSYIPTTGAAVTRAADLADRTLGPEYDAVAGTAVVIGDTADTSGAGISRILSLNSGSGSRIDAFIAPQPNRQLTLDVADGGSVQASPATANPVASDGSFKAAASFAENDFAVALDGAPPATEASGTVPAVTKLSLGTGPTGDHLNGHISSLVYYPRRLPDADLQELTA
ncbi:phage head spike fiber domain-containing protein [Acidimangrovimonas pyrenivorans]|uniref:Concanavalin A-like lectin/glucanases superfamily protein n=1 Tax=Acidimangrovimonas pyrenivorans TaxID=2030798 RepID=A0ABV7ANN9_9RHOB